MRKIIILTVIMLMSWAMLAVAEPVAPLLPYNEMGKQMLTAQGKSVADALKDVPTKAAVDLPVYPGSYVGTAGTSDGVLNSIQFVSRDSPEKIIAWYKKQLGDGWKYLPEFATKELGEVGVFVETDKSTVNVMDTLRSRMIRIAKVEKPDDTGFLAMAFDVTGIKTMINMQIKPMM